MTDMTVPKVAHNVAVYVGGTLYKGKIYTYENQRVGDFLNEEAVKGNALFTFIEEELGLILLPIALSEIRLTKE